MISYKVVFHIDESNKWKLVLTNVNNLIKDLGQINVVIEIVANSVAVKDYVEDNRELINEMELVHKNGAKFIACRNALKSNNIDEKLLPAYVKVVPAGITELVIRQEEGYCYIKP